MLNGSNSDKSQKNKSITLNNPAVAKSKKQFKKIPTADGAASADASVARPKNLYVQNPSILRDRQKQTKKTDNAAKPEENGNKNSDRGGNLSKSYHFSKAHHSRVRRIHNNNENTSGCSSWANQVEPLTRVGERGILYTEL